MSKFNVEYSWDNLPQEGEYGVLDKDFDTLVEAYAFAARVINRARYRNEHSLLCCGQPEDHFVINLRITRRDYSGQQLPDWQFTIVSVFYDGDEHAMWLGTDSEIHYV